MIRTSSTTTSPTVAALPAILLIAAITATTRSFDRLRNAATQRGDGGQATAEYALVLLGAAAIAMAIVSWVSKANPIGGLLDFVLKGVLGKAK